MCLNNKFPFAACTNQEIVVKSFNSNFNCVCQINLPSDVKENKDKYIFKYSENDTIKDGNILDKNDNEFEKLSKDPMKTNLLSQTIVSQAQLAFICSNSAIMTIIVVVVVVVDSQHVNARWNSLLP